MRVVRADVKAAQVKVDAAEARIQAARLAAANDQRQLRELRKAENESLRALQVLLAASPAGLTVPADVFAAQPVRPLPVP